MTFWENFYSLCIQNGTKPNPVAKKIGLSSATVTQWKKGAVPSSASAAKIAEYFGVSVDYLLGNEQTKNITMLPLHYEEQIRKYRTLDEYGKEAVDSVLEVEYKRCKENKDIKIKKPDIAARIDGGGQGNPKYPDSKVFSEVADINNDNDEGELK